MTYSVVIPCYNAAATIVATVQSCLQQSMPPLELIVVDDCSSDNSLEQVKDAFGSKVKILKLPQNSGPSAARNAGWNVAKGDFVAFVDSDDTWHPNKMAICMQLLQQHTDTDLLWHDYHLGQLPAYDDVLYHQLPLETTTHWTLLTRNLVSTSAVIFKTSLPLRFDESMRHCEDYDIAIRTAYAYRVRYVPLVLTAIGRPILSVGGLSDNLWAMRKGEMRTYMHFAGLHPLYILLLPGLLLWSLCKHWLRVLGIR